MPDFYVLHTSVLQAPKLVVLRLSLNLVTFFSTSRSLSTLLLNSRQNKMEAVKKKLATLKEEKELAVEKAEEAEKAKKEAEERAEQVRYFTAFESSGKSCASACLCLLVIFAYDWCSESLVDWGERD